MLLQLSGLKSQLEEQKVRLEKTHADQMEKLLLDVMSSFLCVRISFRQLFPTPCMPRLLHSVLFCAPCVSCGWRRGAAVNIVGRIGEVNQHRARLVLGWVTIFSSVNHLGM